MCSGTWLSLLSGRGPDFLTSRTGCVRRLGLTGAEAEVVLALAEGLTPEEISLRREVSLHTIRSQFKAVRAKTGSRRQVDLMRLVENLRGGR